MEKIIRSLIVFVIFYLFTACNTTSENFTPVTDELSNENLSTQVVEPWEDGLRTDPDNKEFEWWYFDFSFSDGTTAVIFFSTKSFLNPSAKPDPEFNIVITDPDGTEFELIDKPGSDSFSASEKNLDIEFGDNFIRGDLDSCTIYYEKDDFLVDLYLVSEAPAWRPGSGVAYYDKNKTKYFAWLPAIPFGRVEGTLRYKGETVKVSGTGYHDHNWGNIRLDKIKTQWYWGRARIDDYTIIFSQMLTTPKYGSEEIPVFYLAKGNKVLSSDSYDLTFTPAQWVQHKGGRDYPENITINIQDSEYDAVIKISAPAIIEAQSLLERAPWIVRILSKPFTNPYYFRFTADYSLEYKDSFGTINKQAKGIYEMMLLRGLQTVR